jgi:hypothetical protein
MHHSTAQYVKQHFRTATKGNFDIYSVFVERGLELLNKNGELGFIIPNKFFTTDYGATLRELIAEKGGLRKVIDFGHSQVFAATTYTCLLFLSAKAQRAFEVGTADAAKGAAGFQNIDFQKHLRADISSEPWNFASSEAQALLRKITEVGELLLDLPAEMNRGSSTGADDVFMVGVNDPGVESDVLRVPIFASDFGRFEFRPKSDCRVIFPYELTSNGASLFSEELLKKRYPGAYKHLKNKRRALEDRAQYREWYGFSAPRSLAQHDHASILVPLLANRGLNTLIPASEAGRLCPMAGGGFTISLGKECHYHPAYVLGLLNSAALFWVLRQWSNVFRGGWVTCTKQYFGKLPIRKLDLRKRSDKIAHDEIVELVQRQIEARVELKNSKIERDVEYWTRRIEHVENELEERVAALYDLTKQERRFIETFK